MGEEISLYELFQLNILNDADLLEIGKKPYLEKIILIKNIEKTKVQILYGKGGWLFSEYKSK